MFCLFTLKDTQEDLGVVDVVPGSLRIGGTFSQGQRHFKLESFEVKKDGKDVEFYKAYCLEVPASEEWLGQLK